MAQQRRAPARRRVAELRLKDTVTGHRVKARIDVALLAFANPINSRLHVVVNPTSRHTAEDTECVPMSIEQHLMCLKRIRAHQEGTAVWQLDMCNLQLDPLPTNIGPVLAPIKLERFTRLEHQRHERSPPSCLFEPRPVSAPGPCKSGHTRM